MNYLAHLYLAANSPESIIGSISGDFVKGSIENKYPEGVKRGIILHRKTDAYTDSHIKNFASRNLISPKRRRFAGIIVDLSYDHFLCKHWSIYTKVELPLFISNIYKVLCTFKNILPVKLRAVLPIMVRENWLGSYQELGGVEIALNRLSRRIKRGDTLWGSIEEIELNYPEMEANFLAFFPDLVKHVRSLKELT